MRNAGSVAGVDGLDAGLDVSKTSKDEVESITIRLITASDESNGNEEIIRSIWMSGFEEQGPHIYESLKKSLFPICTTVTACVAATLYFLPRWWQIAGTLLYGGAATLFYTTDITCTLLTYLIHAGALKQAKKMKGIAALWSVPSSSFFIAENQDGKIMGCCGLKFLHTLAPGVKDDHHPSIRLLLTKEGSTSTEASIWRLSVANFARRKGVAQLLVKNIELYAKSRGATHISLICGNPDSVKFYTAQGFLPETQERARKAMWSPETNFLTYFLQLPMLKSRLSRTIFYKALL